MSRRNFTNSTNGSRRVKVAARSAARAPVYNRSQPKHEEARSSALDKQSTPKLHSVKEKKLDIQAKDSEVVKINVVRSQVAESLISNQDSGHLKTKKKPHKKRQAKNYEKRQSVGMHIDELRRRLLGCVAALIIGGAIGYHFQTQIIAWLVKPLNQQLFYTSPTGGFDFLIKICLFFGFLLAIPIIIYNFIRFLAPAVPERVSYSTMKLLVLSVILAALGVSFAYYISLPAALHFLNGFNNEQVQSLISAQEYFNFVMIYLAGFAALFQMPLIFAFINKVTPLKPQILMQKQRLVILVSFIVAAVLTPTPDPMNQTIMAIPIIGLYQTSIGVVWQGNRRKKRKEAKRAARHGNQEVMAVASQA